MAFPNSTYADVVSTTIESRGPDVADNMKENNAIYYKMSKRGNVKPFTGGTKIVQPLSFAENGNAAWYSGYDTLSVGAQDVITAAEYSIKQIAVAVPISGLEKAQNSGKEALIDLLDARLEVAESTMENKLAEGAYADGTGNGGKELTGLGAAVPIDPTTGTYGGINRATASNTFWRSRVTDTNAAPVSTTTQGLFNAEWAAITRGTDHPDLILCDSTAWAEYLESLQAIQRFSDPEMAKLGFTTVKFMSADVVLDGGVGGNCPTGTTFFLNTKYIFLRPHKDFDMVSLGGKRMPVNQDAEVHYMAWYGNMACSGSRFQSRLIQS